MHFAEYILQYYNKWLSLVGAILCVAGKERNQVAKTTSAQLKNKLNIP